MLKKNGEPPLRDVSNLSAGVVEPNPQRVAALKQWHIDQAISETKPVAIINITLTAAGEINSRAIGLEPEHAKVMLPALEDAAQQLREQVGYEQQPRIFPDSRLNLMKRKRDLLGQHGSFCQACGEEFPITQLHVRTERGHSATSSIVSHTLNCEPCLHKDMFAQAISPAPRFKIV